MSWPDQKYVKFPFVKTTNIQCQNGVGTNGISIGKNAGYNTQGTNAVAVGVFAGQNTQGRNAVAIGFQAGQTNQGSVAVAIGSQAGQTNQGSGAVAVGQNAGQIIQGVNAVAIGESAGTSTQGSGAVAIGSNAGQIIQGNNAVAIGPTAATNTQGANAVAIGYLAATNTQRPEAVAVGNLAGQNTQGSRAVAIGYSAGNIIQGENAVAIGASAGSNTQGTNAVAIGNGAGQNIQGRSAVAIGPTAGNNTQGVDAIAIGNTAGAHNQGTGAVAIAQTAGQTGQGSNAIAIGNSAGQQTQGGSAIAIGVNAGVNNQGGTAVAIGNQAGSRTQGVNAIAIGTNAGQTNQGSGAVAIGINAGASSQAANSIVISALGTIVTGATANATYIAPIRNIYNNQLLEYNTTTKEITYQPNYFDPSGNLDLSCNLIQDVSGIFFCDGTYIGSGSSFDISTNQVLHISSSQNVLIDVSSSVIINGNLGIAGTTGQLNYYVYNTTTFSALNTWFRIARFTNQQRTDINLFISTVSGGAYGTTKICLSNISSLQADWNNVNSGYGIQGVRFATESSIVYLEILSNISSPIVGISSSYITGTNFIPLEFTSTSGSVASNTFLFASYGTLNGGSFVTTIGYNYNILTNGLERIRISTAGNVGIGTTTPTETLDVSGTIKATLFKTGGIASNTAGFTNSVYLESSVPSLTFSNTLGPNFGKYTLGATNGNFGIWNNALSSYPLYINSSSNVGIGTTIPSARLDLKYDSPDSSFNVQVPNGLRIHNTNPTVDAIGLLSFAASVAGTAVGGIGIVNTGLTSSGQNLGRLTFYTKPTLTSLLTEKMTILGDGNVGIGTTTPSNKLDVRGITRITNDDGVSMLYVNWTTPTGISPTILNSLINSGAGYGELQTRGSIQTFYTTTTERMRIASNGNVGIGTTTPETKLDVVGESIQCSNQGRFKGWYSAGGSGLAAEIGTLGGEGYINTYNRTAGVYGNLNLIAGTANMKLTTSGNIGIGTTTPTEKLNISGGNLLMGGTFDGLLMNPGSGAGSLAITRSGNFINNVQQIIGTPTYTDNVGGSSGGGAQVSLLKNEMSFSTYPNTGTLGANITLTERMRITSTGVGINTIGVNGGPTTPNYKLHVEGSGTANEIVGWFNNQGAFSSSIAVRMSSKTAYLTNHSGLGTPNYDGQLSNAISYGVSSGSSPIQFWNGNTGVGGRGTAKMTLLETGNVGIGTTTPAYPLDVVGSAKMTTIRDTANSVGTAGQVLSSTGSALSWTTPSFSLPMAIIQETQTAGTNSAISFVTGTSRPRQFNSKTEAGLSITLSGTPNWTFTIPTAGTYLIEANACYTTSSALTSWSTKLLLNNQTLGLGALIIGGNSKLVGTSSGTAGTMNDALLSGIITITGITVFSLDHYAVYGGSMSGGVALNLPAGTTEVYATLKITKIS